MHMREPPVPPVPGCQSTPVSGVRGGQRFEGRDWVAQELPVALEYNGISHAVMLATPSDLEDFALGFSRTEGIVEDAAQVYDIDTVHGERGITLSLRIAAGCMERLKEQRRTLAGRTGCGLCGAQSLDAALRPVVPVPTGAPIASTAVVRALGQLRERQPLLGITGATHAAAWCNAAGDIVHLREDVGRHNALDKLIGALLRAAVPAAPGFILISSRASFEMVQKAAIAGVGVLAAVSGVTALAVSVAEEAGVALLGFARGEDLSIYSHAGRVALEATP